MTFFFFFFFFFFLSVGIYLVSFMTNNERIKLQYEIFESEEQLLERSVVKRNTLL